MKNHTMTGRLVNVAMVIAVMAVTNVSIAQVINVDFGLTPYTGASANGPIVSGTNWNHISIANDFVPVLNGMSWNNLLDDSGTLTAVSVAFGTGWAGFFNNSGPNNLQRDRAFTSGGNTGTFTISGLNPGGTYNLALMVDEASSTDFTIGGTTLTATAGSAGAGNGPLTFPAGQRHVLFSGISASVGGDITFSATQAAGSSNGSLPGLQIEDVTPASTPGTLIYGK